MNFAICLLAKLITFPHNWTLIFFIHNQEVPGGQPACPALWNQFLLIQPDGVDRICGALRLTSCMLDRCPFWLIKVARASLSEWWQPLFNLSLALGVAVGSFFEGNGHMPTAEKSLCWTLKTWTITDLPLIYNSCARFLSVWWLCNSRGLTRPISIRLQILNWHSSGYLGWWPIRGFSTDE